MNFSILPSQGSDLSICMILFLDVVADTFNFPYDFNRIFALKVFFQTNNFKIIFG